MRLRLALVTLSLIASIGAMAQTPAPLPKLDPATFDPYLGTYRFASGRLLVIGRTERRLYAYEPGTERVRALDRVDDRTWIAGPSLLAFKPEEFRVRFLRNNAGAISALRYEEPGRAAMQAAKSRAYTEEQVTFRNGDVTLAGTLFLPASKGPHPAIVVGHGSGAQDRNGFLSTIRFFADHLARHGIAVLTYDKRGTGRSTGDWSRVGFTELASDLVAGVRMLRERPEIDRTFVGVGGSSQTGWVAAKATMQLPDIAFVCIVSAGGSGLTVEEQNLYNTEVEMRAQKFSDEQVRLALDLQRRFFDVLRRGEGADAREYDEATRAAQKDAKLAEWLFPLSSEIDWKNRSAWYTALEVLFDPLTAWRAYPGPVLGVFGELDAQTPVAQVVPRLTEALMSRKNTDFTITVFPKASHLLMEATMPSDAELENLQRFVPGAYDFISDWLWGRVKRNHR
ncbi:MAG TPA: alpha/beta fold hydrolase [Thermoanaerobaculia bacterium]|nr:alpha/beta fold hydrolase [Thermoanaerobaculia bacterium]